MLNGLLYVHDPESLGKYLSHFFGGRFGWVGRTKTRDSTFLFSEKVSLSSIRIGPTGSLFRSYVISRAFSSPHLLSLENGPASYLRA